MTDFGEFVERLALADSMPSVFNPYAGQSGETRRANLQLYLDRMAVRQPRILLVGEAPGYRGCRVTGVPFTSTTILLSEPSPFDLFGSSAGFRLSFDGDEPARETTATILWQTLLAQEFLPLLWNAFPFHPYRLDQPRSNRTPNRAELATGSIFLADLVSRYPIERIIAVGNKAWEALGTCGMAATKIRHPARGGKVDFGRELSAAISVAEV
jgi:hypothetical protein